MTAGGNAGLRYTCTQFKCDGCGTKRWRKDPANNPFKLQPNGSRICGMCIELRKYGQCSSVYPDGPQVPCTRRKGHSGDHWASDEDAVMLWTGEIDELAR